MQVRIKNTSQHELPAYAKEGDAGMDLRANLIESVSLTPMQTALIPTGLFIQLEKGYEAQIRSRSGLALKNKVVVLNSPGTIDSGYRDEIKVILINHSSETFIISNGDRIAQMVIAQHETVKWQVVSELDTTDRNGGFGSSGIK